MSLSDYSIYMCACEDGRTCHRRTVGELLEKRGYSVAEYKF